MLVLKHTDALINLDMHQFLKSDPVKRLDPETKYRRLRQYFSERWGPHSSLDVAKIKADLTTMRGNDPRWHKYLQNFNHFVGSLESTQQRDANDAIIYAFLTITNIAKPKSAIMKHVFLKGPPGRPFNKSQI